MDVPEIIVEFVTKADARTAIAIDALLHQLTGNAKPFGERELQKIVDCPDTRLAVAKAGGRVIGTATACRCLSPTGTKWWIEDVVVDSACRGNHAGSTLMRSLLLYVQGQGHGAKVMLTSRPSRETANIMYRHLGFKQKETNVYTKVLDQHGIRGNRSKLTERSL